MESTLKKFLPIAGLLCGVFGTTLSADDSQDMSAPAGRMSDDQMQGDITPSAGPRVTNGADVYITADFIYWTPRMEGLAYTFSGYSDGTVDTARGGFYHPNWQWDPGFKVGLGLNLDHNGWDLFAEYTWLHSHASSDTGAVQTTLYPIWNIGNLFTTPDDGASGLDDSIIQASNNWRLRFNNIDFDLGRNYFISQYLAFRPSVGFKGAWMNQKYVVNYGSPQIGNSATQVFYNNRMSQTLRFWGFGIRSGLDSAWHFTKNFSIYGNMGLSALWSQFKVSRTDQEWEVADKDNTTVSYINTENTFHTIKPVIEMTLGLRYETFFSDNDYHFAIEAGWENQVWINMNQFLSLSEEGSHGDLSLQGLTVQLRFDF